MKKKKTKKKPSSVSRLYWSYLVGKLDPSELTPKQFNQIVLEQYIQYKQRGGYKSLSKGL
ncbi:hypothetical protein ACWA2B_10770 [Paenibacillus sp. CMM36]